ncbi:hypothetical protein C2E23DRAFT_829443 [Lenzites betulinus]|nr:hypothetical protein C2E23DRAFT_829443 [Lenzites betulinus]
MRVLRRGRDIAGLCGLTGVYGRTSGEAANVREPQGADAGGAGEAADAGLGAWARAEGEQLAMSARNGRTPRFLLGTKPAADSDRARLPAVLLPLVHRPSALALVHARQAVLELQIVLSTLALRNCLQQRHGRPQAARSRAQGKLRVPRTSQSASTVCGCERSSAQRRRSRRSCSPMEHRARLNRSSEPVTRHTRSIFPPAFAIADRTCKLARALASIARASPREYWQPHPTVNLTRLLRKI